MSVPLLGIILLPLGILLLCLSPGRLPVITLFMVPFSASTVLVYDGATTPHWLPVVNWFGILWLVSKIPAFMRDGSVHLPPKRGASVTLLIAFTLVAGCSLIMPLLVAGNVRIESASLTDDSVFPLELRLNHLLVLWDLVFGVCFALLVARWSCNRDTLELALRIFVWSGVAVSVWGLLEYASFYGGPPYPSWLFNNNPEDAAGVARVLRGEAAIEIRRITSVAVEPSILAQVLVATVPIIVFSMWTDRPLLTRTLDRAALAVLLTTLVLSTSVTALAGLLFLTGAIPLGLFILGRTGLRPMLWLGALAGGVVVAYWQVDVVRTFVTSFVLTKPTSDSGLERLVTVLNAWHHFLRYPILGLGWGSVPSTDLIVKLLANTGVLGLTVFVLMAAAVFRSLLRAVRTARDTADEWLAFRATAVGVSLATVLFVSAIARFTYEYAHFWLVLGLALAVPGALSASTAAGTQSSESPA
jgi:hypothetical protein